MLNDEFDPYDQLMGLTQSHWEIARALNDQSRTVEQLIRTLQAHKQEIQNLNNRLTQLELEYETSKLATDGK